MINTNQSFIIGIMTREIMIRRTRRKIWIIPKKKKKNRKIITMIMIITFNIISIALTSKLNFFTNQKLSCFQNASGNYKCERPADYSQSRLSNPRVQTLTHVSTCGFSIALSGCTCHGWLPLRLVSWGKARDTVWLGIT